MMLHCCLVALLLTLRSLQRVPHRFRMLSPFGKSEIPLLFLLVMWLAGWRLLHAQWLCSLLLRIAHQVL